MSVAQSFEACRPAPLREARGVDCLRRANSLPMIAALRGTQRGLV